MGLFIREDPGYDESVRQRGFNRYKQLLSIRFGQWWKVNLLTLAGCLPLAAGIVYSIGVSSVLVLLPCSLLGGMAAGPFLAGLYDAILRGLRDDPTPWRDAWARSWRQNWRGSLVPGALLGLMAGLYAFMGMLFWWAEMLPSLGNCLLFCVKYFWRVMGAGLLQLAYTAILVLFAPWSLFLLPVTGAWYIVFLAQLIIYDQMDEALQIEKQYEARR